MLPWTFEQFVSLVIANVTGLGLMIVGWWQTDGRDSTSEQLGWLNLSILGLVVAGSANVLWLARGRRTVTLAKSLVLPSAWIRGGAEESLSIGGAWEVIPGVPTLATSSNGTAATPGASMWQP